MSDEVRTRTHWRDEKKVGINPSWIIQAVVLLLIAIIGFLVSDKLESIDGGMVELQKELKSESQLSRIERTQLRSDMTTMERGMLGDRFTRTDWLREKEEIDRKLKELRDEIRSRP